MSKVLVICGSLREGSYNRKLLNVAIKLLVDLGAEVQDFDFRSSPLPIYDASLEAAETLPEGVIALKEAINQADAIVIASPEYNAGVTPLMKNAIDWVSREDSKKGRTNEWSNKVISVLTVSPGAFGGIRAQGAYRQSLAMLGALVLPETVTVPNAAQAFDESGALTNERSKGLLDKSMKRLLEVSSRLKGL